MAGFTKYADIVTAIANGQTDVYSFEKTFGATPTVDTWVSFWNAAGSPPAGSYASQADNAATVGAMNGPLSGSAGGLNDASVSPALRSLISFGASCNIVGVIMLYDRLVEVSGLSLTTAGSVTVSSSALTRFTGGKGVQAWLEVTTATSTTAPVVYLNSYTNDSGTAGQNAGSSATLTFPAAATKVQTMVGPFPLAAGDQGVRAVSTFDVSTASSAGVCSLVLLKPLAYLPIGIANTWTERDFALQFTALENIPDNACLALAMFAGTATAPILMGRVATAWL